MRKETGPRASTHARHAQAIKRQAQRKFAAEETIRIVPEGLRGKYSIAGLRRCEGIAPGQLWQTDFTCLKVIGRGWFKFSTVLDKFSRLMIAWRPCAGIAPSDVQDTLNLAMEASDFDEVVVIHRPGLVAGNRPSYISGDLAGFAEDKGVKHSGGAPHEPLDPGHWERPWPKAA